MLRSHVTHEDEAVSVLIYKYIMNNLAAVCVYVHIRLYVYIYIYVSIYIYIYVYIYTGFSM